MKKIERAAAFLSRHASLFRCPVCHAAYDHVAGNSLICPAGHNVDLSKKGTLYFMQRAVASEYDDAMLAARRRMLQAGLFTGITTAFANQLPQEPQTILDVGCGEGTPLTEVLSHRAGNDTAVGFDISKPGINLATQLDTPAFFCVADLAQMPFTDHQFTAVLDLFSPSAYQEFNRIIAPGGQLLKVIPNPDYLIELRQALFAADNPHAQYDNSNVLSLFKRHYPEATSQRIRYQVPIAPERFSDLMLMTPMHWGASEAQLERVAAAPFSQITVDVTLLQARF
ncbi:methyltransferase domain-containing protein [Levilactobacillus suantsaii]|uniref:Methyltransferase domain-containing protein n=1 Tax=Levilactobacillus suantsaii TaxID=2292255 RepID=A0A4Q0VIF9_9LACO|nr:methyltransferase domain-containing protein [Levilactobacillus suantsaii]QMU07413.1 methyltransferase domain-containing protein [Levilactobacillus suantsaii]RXI79214.1 methyltransferase domain-containing protein [Levilactobacillus suantsaii]